MTREIEPTLYRPYLTILLDGLRGDRGPITTLPVDAPSLEQTHQAFKTRSHPPHRR